jgi:hypothetical protein
LNYQFYILYIDSSTLTITPPMQLIFWSKIVSKIINLYTVYVDLSVICVVCVDYVICVICIGLEVWASNSQQTTHHNTNLTAVNINLNTTQDTKIKGANLQATNQLSVLAREDVKVLTVYVDLSVICVVCVDYVICVICIGLEAIDECNFEVSPFNNINTFI